MKTDPSTIHRFLGEAHHCAMQMMENGSYILRELPSLRMSDAVRLGGLIYQRRDQQPPSLHDPARLEGSRVFHCCSKVQSQRHCAALQ